MRRLLVLPAAAVLLGGCLGSDPESPPRPAAPVGAVLELERPQAGPPDAGTATGHGAGAGAVAITRGERFVLRGTVRPASSEVRLLDGATREQSAIARRRGAAFAFTIEHLQPGANRYVVEATHPDREPWRQALRITRRAPRVAVERRVVVPREDPSPAEAELRLDRRRLVAVAIGRDPGGMARIRVSADLQLRCAADGGTREIGLVRHEPPSQVARVRVRAGTRVPGELRRRSDLRAAARTRCGESGGALAAVEGVVWAEATNAHGRDRYSAKVPIRPLDG